MSIGAGIGFIFGIIFTIIAAIRVDQDEATVGEAMCSPRWFSVCVNPC